MLFVLNATTESRLKSRVLEGNRDAMIELYMNASGIAHGVARPYFGREDHEDILQTAKTALWESITALPANPPSGRFSTGLHWPVKRAVSRYLDDYTS